MLKQISIVAFLGVLFFLLSRPEVEQEAGGFLHPDSGEPRAGESIILSSFSDNSHGWSISGEGEASRSRRYSSEGLHSLQITASPDGQAVLASRGDFNLFGYDTLSFDTYLPSDDAGQEVYVSFADYENFWYQTAETFKVSHGWNSHSIDISCSTSDVVPLGHYRPWSRSVAGSIREVNIKFQVPVPFSFSVYIDNIRIEKSSSLPVAGLSIKDIYINAPDVEKHGMFQAGFALSREYSNPFDPEEVEITGIFISPSGKQLTVPGFFYQEYSRRIVHGQEHLIPVGNGQWRVRFAPSETGRYRYRLKAEDGTDSFQTGEMEFLSVPSSNPGHILTSKTDPCYFEFENGRFFYPIGLNIISPWDTPYQQRYVDTLPVGLGTYVYDDYMEKMSANGMNFFRMWMAHWWLTLEWNPDKGPFKGIGSYSMSNAWRLDHIIRQAEERGIYVLLTINNHTRLTGHERGWEMNPYNKANGGFLERQGDYFTDEQARKLFRRKLRYIIARWGYSTSIFSLDLWSEVDLTGGFHSGNVKDWHNEMGLYIKEKNPFKQMVSTHFCIPSNALQWSLPEGLDFIHSNAWVGVDRFSDSQIEAVVQYYEKMKKFGTPVFISEYGGHYSVSEDKVMIRDLHSGLWANYMAPLAASPQFWWWNLVHEKDLYFHYRALARFAEGRDPRGKNFRQKRVAVKDETDRLSAMAFGNSREVDVWVYNFFTALRVSDEKQVFSGAIAVLSDMEDGTYSIEFWDTYEGRVTGNKTAVAHNGLLKINLPCIERDIAFKIRRLR